MDAIRKYYPVLIDLMDRSVLVVGGGSVSERKVLSLLEHGARVSLVSRDLTETLQELVKKGSIVLAGEVFRETHLDDTFLVVAATDDTMLNQRVSRAAAGRGLLVNAVDQPLDCNFIVPSIVRRGDLIIAISTSGKSPAFAADLRRKLEREFGEEYAVFLVIMGRLRKEVLSLGMPQEQNRAVFDSLVNSDVMDALADRDWERVESIISGLIPKEISVKKALEDLRSGGGM